MVSEIHKYYKCLSSCSQGRARYFASEFSPMEATIVLTGTGIVTNGMTIIIIMICYIVTRSMTICDIVTHSRHDYM